VRVRAGATADLRVDDRRQRETGAVRSLLRVRRVAVLATVCAALVTAPLSPAAATTRPWSTMGTHGTVLFIGDSITARYDDKVGDPQRGWWSIVAAKMGMRPVTSAESGSGMLAAGGGAQYGVPSRGACRGTTFGERLGDVAAAHPTVIVVEGGRNDFKRCVGGKTVTKLDKKRTEAAVKAYLAQLKTAAARAGVPARNVYVLSPWGTAYPSERAVVRPLVKKYALAEGFHWIATSYLADRWTVDRTHPNTAGNVELARRVVKLSDLTQRWHAPRR